MAIDTKTPYRMGVDIGSTTMKVAVLDADGTLVFSAYQRHQADIKGTAADIVGRLYKELGNVKVRLVITGSVGMGYAQRLDIGFV
ncbi:MAG: hypothetical protein J6X65_03840 [Bacteroidales bacterium]|nr:hypothetical protein [Bacteroidales bacterium]